MRVQVPHRIDHDDPHRLRERESDLVPGQAVRAGEQALVGGCPEATGFRREVGAETMLLDLASGTGRPERVRTKIPPSTAGPVVKRGSTSSTTRYWLVWVNNVETCRCPNAL